MRREEKNKGNNSREQPGKPGLLYSDVVLAETAPLSGKTVVTLFKDALPLIGLLLLPAFALRALIAARFDLTVATALVQYTQPLNFALVFLLSTVPPLIFVMGLMALFWSGIRLRPGTPGQLRPIIGAYLIALASSVPLIMTTYLPAWYYYLPVLPLFPLAFEAGQSRWFIYPNEHPFAKLHNPSMDYPSFLIIFILPYLSYQGPVWLAPETLTIRDIPKTEYVLQQQDQDLIIFDPDLHAVIRVPTADVSHRQFCNIRSSTLAERLFDGPQGRPLCPK